jgi:hypothetical protein
MPTIIGTNTVTAISKQYIFDEIIDGVYPTNALFFRLNGANKKAIAGGMHLEQPFVWQTFQNGGAYDGYDLLDTAPNDNVLNGGWDMKQYDIPVTVSGRDLARCNTPEALVNLLTNQWNLARMDLSNRLGTGIYTDGVTNTKEIDGIKGAVDDGTVLTSYAGLLRATYPFLSSQRDASTATLTLAALEAMISNCTVGGHSPTLILSRKEQYRRLHALLIANQRFIASATDVELGNAGFRNITFDGIPWVIDSKVPDGPNASNSSIYFLNENTMKIVTWSDVDFEMIDFIRPTNQDAMVGHLRWYGNLVVDLPYVNGVMTNVSA